MNTLQDIQKNHSLIERKLGYSFQDKSLLTMAFVHRSFVNEHREALQQHNERLEFLGDAILGLIISDYLYKYLPSMPEGELSHLRSRLVEASSCVCYIQKIEVEPYLLLGRGEKMNDGRGRITILADLFEALIGAIFLDGGLESAQRFLFQNFSPIIQNILSQPLNNWKAILQDYAQKKYQHPPTYEVVSETGPDHSKTFVIRVLINGIECGQGEGPSKKEAQQAAADNAWRNVLEQERV